MRIVVLLLGFSLVIAPNADILLKHHLEILTTIFFRHRLQVFVSMKSSNVRNSPHESNRGDTAETRSPWRNLLDRESSAQIPNDDRGIRFRLSGREELEFAVFRQATDSVFLKITVKSGRSSTLISDWLLTWPWRTLWQLL